jgi:hypothetical protein
MPRPVRDVVPESATVPDGFASIERAADRAVADEPKSRIRQSIEAKDQGVPIDPIAAAFARGIDEPAPEPMPRSQTKVPTPRTRTAKKAAEPPQTASGRPAGADELQDLFATGLILLVTFSIGEQYNPTAEEALAIARPLSNILARRVDLAAKLGRDANDTVAFIVGVLVYLSRVGPMVSHDIGERMTARNARRTSEPPTPIRGVRPDQFTNGPRNIERTDRMAPGTVQQGLASPGADTNPLDAVAMARSIGLDVLGRDVGPVDGGYHPMAADGNGQ